MNVNPYLDFNGRCDEAIEFYKGALGAEVNMLMRFKDMPPVPNSPEGCGVTPGTENKVMHAELRIGDALLFASDGRCTGQANFHGIALSISADNDEKAAKIFNALSNGGKVNMPLGKTFFASTFGMVNDRFGVGWMVIVQKR
jgi:PhnB protein